MMNIGLAIKNVCVLATPPSSLIFRTRWSLPSPLGRSKVAEPQTLSGTVSLVSGLTAPTLAPDLRFAVSKDCAAL